MCCDVAFPSSVVLSGSTIIPTWWGITCNGKFSETENSLQAWMPSVHVWATFGSPVSPQSLNQEPLQSQQLCLPDLLVVSHLIHVLLLLASDGLVTSFHLGIICLRNASATSLMITVRLWLVTSWVWEVTGADSGWIEVCRRQLLHLILNPIRKP